MTKRWLERLQGVCSGVDKQFLPFLLARRSLCLLLGATAGSAGCQEPEGPRLASCEALEQPDEQLPAFVSILYRPEYSVDDGVCNYQCEHARFRPGIKFEDRGYNLGDDDHEPTVEDDPDESPGGYDNAWVEMEYIRELPRDLRGKLVFSDIPLGYRIVSSDPSLDHEENGGPEDPLEEPPTPFTLELFETTCVESWLVPLDVGEDSDSE